jgi:hypothetical protein
VSSVRLQADCKADYDAKTYAWFDSNGGEAMPRFY